MQDLLGIEEELVSEHGALALELACVVGACGLSKEGRRVVLGFLAGGHPGILEVDALLRSWVRLVAHGVSPLPLKEGDPNT